MRKRRYLPESVMSALVDALAETGNDPEGVVEIASKPDSPLHDAADWKWGDDAGAAHEYRVGIARALIRSVPQSAITQGTNATIRPPENDPPAYVRDPRLPTNKRGYVRVMDIEQASEMARSTVLREFAMAISYLRRAHSIAESLGIRSVIEAVLQAALDAEEHIKTMPLKQAKRSTQRSTQSQNVAQAKRRSHN